MQTINYQEDVVNKKHEKLKTTSMMHLKDLYNTQLNLIREQSLEQFKNLIKNEFDEKEIYPDFGVTISKLNDDVLKDFFDVKVGQSIVKDSGWTFDVERTNLVNAIQELITRERTVQIEKIMKHFEVKIFSFFNLFIFFCFIFFFI